ncbi:protein phosphatase 2C domain-containing protein [Haloarchaeobius sp. HRN-SO-5]|uniref:protein phosphatase 2C domain-containing protein n=1 Tax=Haloarchaeobius sp. HRN-SO-5 TaxID=3446118 RepID=UPI003EB82089
MEHASTIDVGARKRRKNGINEDSIAMALFENHHRQSTHPMGVFALCDGVGGEASGDVASYLAASTIRNRLVDAILGSGANRPERFGIEGGEGQAPSIASDPDGGVSDDWIRARIQEAIDAAHQRIQEYADEIDGRPATTAVAGVYLDGRLHYGWAGDSRVYVINTKHDQIDQLTRDHAVTNELLDRGEIEDDVFARVHEDTTAITNALGGSAYGNPTVDVDFGWVDLYEDDIVLFTSDGLVDAYPDIGPLRRKYRQASDKDEARKELLDVLVTDDEIRDAVLEADALRDGVETLIDLANDRGGKDNLSISLLRDRRAEPTPNSLTDRGNAVESVSTSTRSKGSSQLADKETVIEKEEDQDGGSGSASGDGEPTATIAIGGSENVYEVAPDFTIGRGEVEGSDNPDVGIVVSEDANIESHHARFEHDDSGWLIRDISASGTFVKDGDEWQYFLSPDGIEKSQERGFDPEADPEGLPDDSCRLGDGSEITLHHPQDQRAITIDFFSSADAAADALDL